jgi:hypothetical protein
MLNYVSCSSQNIETSIKFIIFFIAELSSGSSRPVFACGSAQGCPPRGALPEARKSGPVSSKIFLRFESNLLMFPKRNV